MSSMFYGDWCFDLSKGTPPDIVMKSDRMFQITCNVEKETQINVYKKIINSLANRITSLSVTDFVDDELPLHNLLKDIEPAKFANVTSLFLEFCEIDNQCLLLLAPQLESLYLDQICTEFDLSNVTTTSEDESFTRLKSLTLKVVYIDVLKIVEKCSTTLQFLELEFDQHMMKQNTVWSLINFQDLEHDLRSLKSLNVFVDMVEELPGVQNLLSKACRSLVKLDMGFSNLLQLVDLSTLVEHEQSLIIKSLDLKLYSNVNNVNKFLKKCPLTQNLTLEGYEKRIKKVELNNLSTLTLSNCGIKCTRSMLKLVAKTKLRNLHLFAAYDLQMPDLHVISSLDKVSITFGFLLNSEEVDKLTRLFPREEKVLFQQKNFKIIITLYNHVVYLVYDRNSFISNLNFFFMSGEQRSCDFAK